MSPAAVDNQSFAALHAAEQPKRNIDFLDRTERSEADEARKAAFAIECRKVRLWIAKNPGATSQEVKAACGPRYDMALAKMLPMELVRFERTTGEDRRRITRWFVVPK
jgi:hypothetical protein